MHIRYVAGKEKTKDLLTIKIMVEYTEDEKVAYEAGKIAFNEFMNVEDSTFPENPFKGDTRYDDELQEAWKDGFREAIGKRQIYVCAECGSKNVMYMKSIWYDCNTGEIAAEDYKWFAVMCNDCGNDTVELIEDYLDKQ